MKKIITGILAIVGLLFVIILLLVDDPENVFVSMDAPLRVSRGSAFIITIEVTNTGDFPQKVVSIDIAQSYLEGVAIVATEPAFADSMHVPIAKTVEYTFEQYVQPSETLVFEFTATALEPGSYQGDFDIYINNEWEWISNAARTIVE